MAGWVMASSRRRSAGSAKTRAPIQRRSSVPSGWSARGPNASTTRARVGEPGATTARARASASTTGAPRAASRAEKVLFPEAIPPVRPMRRTRSLPGARRLLGALGRLVGERLAAAAPGALAPGLAVGLAAGERERLGAAPILGPVHGDALGVDPDLLEG